MAEGVNTVANGFASHAEGFSTTASGIVSHTEGDLPVLTNLKVLISWINLERRKSLIPGSLPMER
ncbi:hypothetical protein [Bacillus cereus]|uniref:hypothetical protein n=1 Tax=Bacillus cereus group TaxID=86661 RepID=UPI0001A00BAD|nr:hypothetical protein [Bacillus cereus]EEK75624.1 Hep_Hag repeat-containing protein [Bacillus cereus R309803]HDR4563110.1 hypothetical protein [Bacillus luti]